MTKDFAVPVLMYHRIDTLSAKEKTSPLMCDLTVSPEQFDAQVAYLVKNGFSLVSVKQVQDALLGGLALPERSVAITMDDGYKDNFDQAFPILLRYGVSATVFLVTKTLDTPGHLAWNDVNVMRRRQVGVGSHTVSHLDLTTLDADRLDFELRESKRVLEQRLGQPVEAIAYPSGSYNDGVVERTREAGYLSGWKKGGGPVQPGADPLLLPRVRVRGCTTMDDFKRMVWSGVYANEKAKTSIHSPYLQ